MDQSSKPHQREFEVARLLFEKNGETMTRECNSKNKELLKVEVSALGVQFNRMDTIKMPLVIKDRGQPVNLKVYTNNDASPVMFAGGVLVQMQRPRSQVTEDAYYGSDKWFQYRLLKKCTGPQKGKKRSHDGKIECCCGEIFSIPGPCNSQILHSVHVFELSEN